MNNRAGHLKTNLSGEMAEELGKKVTVVEMLSEVGKDVFFINWISLFNKLKENNVVLKTSAKVVSIDSTGLNVECDGKIEHIDADTVVTAFGVRPNRELLEKIKEKYHTKTRAIGDCNKLGKIGDAIREGFYAASSLD